MIRGTIWRSTLDILGSCFGEGWVEQLLTIMTSQHSTMLCSWPEGLWSGLSWTNLNLDMSLRTCTKPEPREQDITYGQGTPSIPKS